MIQLAPKVLEDRGVRLEPLGLEHADALSAASEDGRLWELWFTGIPEPARMRAYIETALEGQAQGHMLRWVVRELASGTVIGSTRYHDVVAGIDRVEIG